MRNDHMVLSAFGQATVSKTQNGAWMHPKSDPNILDPMYYVNLARELEHLGFDMIFFDDRWAMPAVYGNSPRAAVEKGTRAVKLDLLTILGLIAGHTDRIGLGATYSTTYFHPYHVARAFATLDHLSHGRAIWNIVTSLNADEADNFGTEFIEHDARYDRADEFLEVTTGLWETWERDAYKVDRTTGIYADPDKVHELGHKGPNFISKGPLTVPQSPQGWPTLLQAGQSPRGREFAARWADIIFTIAMTKEAGQKAYAAQHAAFEAVGRTAPPGKILPAVFVVVGETESIARERKEFLESITDPIEGLMLLAELAGIDFAQFEADKPLPKDLANMTSGSKAIVTSMMTSVGEMYGPDATPTDLGDWFVKGRGPWFIGTGTQVADGLEEWFQDRACDGFVITQADTPGSWEDFGRFVIPELRRRKLVPEIDRQPRTFRERIGLGDRTSR